MRRKGSALNKKRSCERANPTIFGNILPASVNVGFDHDSGDRAVTRNQLLAD